MKRKVGLALALGVALFSTQGADAKNASRIIGRVYTSQQATEGRRLYRKACAHCHGPHPSAIGPSAPVLAGPAFTSHWEGLPLSQLFERIADTMPQDRPQSLSRQQYACVLAYLLQEAGWPAGDTPLAFTVSELSAMTYLAPVDSPTRRPNAPGPPPSRWP
jgi:mono/diheme cytochrome c family protein